MEKENVLKVSIIIPIYNVECYIEDCVESVRSQTWINTEIILVDDGSQDASPQICDEFQKKDNRVVVIHQENRGAAEARNAGIRVATGEYMMFLDGDDFWNDNHALERLMNRTGEFGADVLSFSYQKYYEDTEKIVPYFKHIPAMPMSCCTKEAQLDYLTKNNLYIASACNKLICRNLFDEELMFISGNSSEDVEWCVRLLKKARSMDFMCENFYCYRQRSDSTTHTITVKKCDDLCNNIISCVTHAKRLDERMRTYLYRYTAYQYGTFFMVQAQGEKEPLDSIKKLSRYQWLLEYRCNNKKLLILHLGCKLLGYERVCKLIRRGVHRRKHLQYLHRHIIGQICCRGAMKACKDNLIKILYG